MQTRTLGHSNIEVAPLVFGGNVFGWTIDAEQSFSLLDAFVDRGFNFIDTADTYSRWVPGNKGGESETDEVDKGEQRCQQGSGAGGEEVQLHQPAGAAEVFEIRADEPERQHGEEGAQDAHGEEGVSQQLPDFAAKEGGGNQREVPEQDIDRPRRNPAEQAEAEEGDQVRQNQAAGRPHEGWQAERDGAGTGHGESISISSRKTG